MAAEGEINARVRQTRVGLYECLGLGKLKATICLLVKFTKRDFHMHGTQLLLLSKLKIWLLMFGF